MVIRARLAAMASTIGNFTSGVTSGTVTSATASIAAMPAQPVTPALPTERYRRPSAAATKVPMIVSSATASNIRTTTGTGQDQARPLTSAMAQQPPTIGPLASNLRAALRAGLSRVNSAKDDVRVAKLGERGVGSGIRLEALVQIPLACLIQPVRQFLDDGRGEFGR